MIYPSLLDFFCISPSGLDQFANTKLLSDFNILRLRVGPASKEEIIDVSFGLSDGFFRPLGECSRHVSLLTTSSRCRKIRDGKFVLQPLQGDGAPRALVPTPDR